MSHSNFAGGLQEYAHGDVEFVEPSSSDCSRFWEELRRADDVEQCDSCGGLHDTDAGQAPVLLQMMRTLRLASI